MKKPLFDQLTPYLHLSALSADPTTSLQLPQDIIEGQGAIKYLTLLHVRLTFLWGHLFSRLDGTLRFGLWYCLVCCFSFQGTWQRVKLGHHPDCLAHWLLCKLEMTRRKNCLMLRSSLSDLIIKLGNFNSLVVWLWSLEPAGLNLVLDSVDCAVQYGVVSPLLSDQYRYGHPGYNSYCTDSTVNLLDHVVDMLCYTLEIFYYRGRCMDDASTNPPNGRGEIRKSWVNGQVKGTGMKWKKLIMEFDSLTALFAYSLRLTDQTIQKSCRGQVFIELQKPWT